MPREFNPPPIEERAELDLMRQHIQRTLSAVAENHARLVPMPAVSNEKYLTKAGWDHVPHLTERTKA